MIYAYIFTYKGDQEETIACVSALKRAFPDSLVNVIEDVHSPLEQGYIEGLLEMGCRVATSHFDRRGNLRGSECVQGMMSYFCEGRLRNDDIVLKVDADTLVLGSDWLKNSLKYDFVASGYIHPQNSGERLAYGCCYAMRGQVAHLVRESLLSLPKSEWCPEDVTIFQAVQKHTDRIKLFEPWNEKAQDSKWTAWNWFSKSVHPRKYIDFDVVTFGNPRPKDSPSYARADAMNRLLNHKMMFSNALLTSSADGL